MGSKELFFFIATLLAVSLYGGTADNEGLVVLRDTKSTNPDFQLKGVCTMTDDDAKVACKMLGYSGGQLKKDSDGALVTVAETYFPLFQKYGCTGAETSLYQCSDVNGAAPNLLTAPGTCDPVGPSNVVVCGAAECLEGDGTNGYAVLDAPKRLTSKTGGPYYCDQGTVPSWASRSTDWKGDLKWYRFGRESGKLAKSVPSTGRCGTNIGAFSPFDLPTTIGVSQDLNVCYGNCQRNKPGKVTNCGSFYVYQLPDVPYCSIRYCAV